MDGKTLQSHLRTVVLLCSSSRGGSSITTEFLRQRDDILHLPAEINPLLHQCISKQSPNGDELLGEDCTPHISNQIWNALAEEIGTYQRGTLTDNDWNRFSMMLSKRLQWQWPSIQISHDAVQDAVQQSRHILNNTYNWMDIFVDKSLFHCVFIDILRKNAHPEIDPRWYDISDAMLDQFFEVDQLGPLIEPKKIIEEPPFVLISPWKKPSLEDVKRKTLIIKTPSNAYRILFFRKLFERQKLHILHLKRDAQSSINGLIDGWRYKRGFHSHILENFVLEDEPSIPKHIWKYDLPPNYQTYISNSSLADICAFQWLSAHEFILRHRHNVDGYHSLWFQDVIDHNIPILDDLWKWLGVTKHIKMDPIQSLPLEMATCTPRQFRWFQRKSIINNLTLHKKIISLMKELQNISKS